MKPLVPGLDLELHLLPFLKGFEALRLNGREVDEYVFTAVLGDEAVSLGIVEPLHSPLGHCEHPPARNRGMTVEPTGARRSPTILRRD